MSYLPLKPIKTADVRVFFQGLKELNFVSLPQQANLSPIPKENAYFLGSIWVQDELHADGISGGAWLGISGGLVCVHTPPSWREFRVNDIKNGFLVVPVQPGELTAISALPGSLEKPIAVSLKFQGYKPRQQVSIATFSVEGIAEPFLDDWQQLIALLELRAAITTLNPTAPDIEI